MKLYCEAEFFETNIDFSEPFEIVQKELIFRKVIDPRQSKYSFSPVKVIYTCSFEKSENFSASKPTIIIPIRDNTELLKFTLDNLETNNITKHCNIIIVDDRSEQDLLSIAKQSSHSYLRVDNKKGFNFSMLNNIAAKICHQLENDTVIFWNSDLWAPNEDMFLELMRRHHQAGSKISGSKLLYPPASMSSFNDNKEVDTENIKNIFPHLKGGLWRETVQFGGSHWVNTPGSPIDLSPVHFKRFTSITDPLVNCDKGETFVTGALHVCDLNFFIEMGGFNPSLSKVFQDVDICLRAYELGHCVMYFGKDIFFYHDESHITAKNKTNDFQWHSDHYLFAKVWNSKMDLIIGHGRPSEQVAK